jgi:imidazolonepropionase-like amidohydrolase
LAALATTWAFGQETAEVYAIRGAKIHTLAGLAIEAGTVLIRDGKIAAVGGASVEIPAGARVIDAEGSEIYPGLIDSVSRLGLTEVGAVAATVDTTELGQYNPQLVAATAVHPASEHIPVTRANGITHAVSAPGSGGGGFRAQARAGIPGQASLIHLAGWTVQEMAIEPSVAMMLSWPTFQTRRFDSSTFRVEEIPFKKVKEDYEERLAELENWFQAARHYAQAVEKGSPNRFERDLKLEALSRVVGRELPVMVLAQSDRDIKNAVEFAEKQNIEMILVGGADAWKVKELLKENDIPVVLGPTQALPREEDDPYDSAFTNAARLHEAGIRIAFATFNSSASRTLPYEAAQAVAFGLPWEEALKAVTLNPAEILGVADRLGTIEEGKIANLIVTNGDPLEIRTEVEHLFINGRPTSTDNKQRQLYETYRARP